MFIVDIHGAIEAIESNTVRFGELLHWNIKARNVRTKAREIEFFVIQGRVFFLFPKHVYC